MKLFCCVAATFAFAPLPMGAQRLLPSATPVSITSTLTFGMVGIAAGQTARVNTLNLAAGGPLIAGAACQVTVKFLDESGKTLSTQTLTSGQGQSAHADLLRSQADASADPVEIRATVSASLVVSTTAATAVASACSVVPTLEIFDQATGRISAHLETTHVLASVVPLMTGAY